MKKTKKPVVESDGEEEPKPRARVKKQVVEKEPKRAAVKKPVSNKKRSLYEQKHSRYKSALQLAVDDMDDDNKASMARSAMPDLYIKKKKYSKKLKE